MHKSRHALSPEEMEKLLSLARQPHENPLDRIEREALELHKAEAREEETELALDRAVTQAPGTTGKKVKAGTEPQAKAASGVATGSSHVNTTVSNQQDIIAEILTLKDTRGSSPQKKIDKLTKIMAALNPDIHGNRKELFFDYKQHTETETRSRARQRAEDGAVSRRTTEIILSNLMEAAIAIMNLDPSATSYTPATQIYSSVRTRGDSTASDETDQTSQMSQGNASTDDHHQRPHSRWTGPRSDWLTRNMHTPQARTTHPHTLTQPGGPLRPLHVPGGTGLEKKQGLMHQDLTAPVPKPEPTPQKRPNSAQIALGCLGVIAAGAAAVLAVASTVATAGATLALAAVFGAMYLAVKNWRSASTATQTTFSTQAVLTFGRDQASANPLTPKSPSINSLP
jgi:hypothetical protein